MKKFIEYLHNKNKKYLDIVITGVEYELKDNLLRVKAQYTCDDFFESYKQEMERDISEYFDNKMLVECKLKKYLVDKDVFVDYASKYIESNYPSLNTKDYMQNINIIKKEDGVFNVIIVLDKDNYAYLEKSNIISDLSEYLSLITKEVFEIELKVIDSEVETSGVDILKQRYKQLNSSEMARIIEYDPIEIRSIHNVVGEIDVDYVYAIATINEQEKAVLAGTIMYYKVNDYESRFKNKDGSPRIAKRVNFVLNDGSDKISCVYFPTIADESKIEELTEGEKIVVVGDVTDSEERGKSCKIKSIALCDFNPVVIPEPEIELKTVNDRYYYIHPKPYVSKKQSDFLVEEEKIDEFLLNNTIVVFDLETTGLNVNECEIIEIGAVKMVNGMIVETFDTLVKPKKPIPEEATAINHITNEMVENSLNIDLVFPDFYRFIDGATLVAYNIDYDYSVLKAYGDKNGYVIANKQVDALKLAKRALPEYKSHKLGKVVKVLNIKLDNAHRALFDTVATAEVLKSTLKLLNEEDKKQLLQ